MGKLKVMRFVGDQTGVKPVIDEIENELSSFQKAVMGRIEIIDLADGISLVANEEGKMVNNALATLVIKDGNDILDVVCGYCFLVSDNGRGMNKSLTEKQINIIRRCMSTHTLARISNMDIHIPSIDIGELRREVEYSNRSK